MMMTNQEAYDIVRAHLLSMTERSFEVNRNGNVICLYNGSNGNHCAIGPLLEGIELSADENGQSLCTLMGSNSEVAARLKDCSRYLLYDLQCVHDNKSYWVYRTEELDEIAKEWDLVINDDD